MNNPTLQALIRCSHTREDETGDRLRQPARFIGVGCAAEGFCERR